MSDDTIAAISTPAVPSAIGVLRLSGSHTPDVIKAVFSSAQTVLDHPRQMIYGCLHDKHGTVIDQALCVYFKAPNSYTGEDAAEFHCHGSPMVLTLGLESLLSHGARQAQAGEFTRRAFLNGKLDLVQAEAVADLLEAQNREHVRHAAAQLSGVLSQKLEKIYSDLTDIMAHFHAVLDYPDEDIDPFRMEALSDNLTVQEQKLAHLLATRQQKRIWSVSCAIVGRPNTGKSSLLNALSGYDRAIVTEIPGTTRDTVEIDIEWNDMPVHLIDTAGLRDAQDQVERIGVARTREAMQQADLILVTWDASVPVSEEDRDLLETSEHIAPTILVLTKCDLPILIPSTPDSIPTVQISSHTKMGLDQLGQAVLAQFPNWKEAREYGGLLANQRQEDAAARALTCIRRAKDALESGVTPDALLTDVEEAMEYIGELTGHTIRADITDRIFQRFCVGK